MKENKLVTISEFEILLSSINCCYAEKVSKRLPKLTDFSNEIYDSNNDINIDNLLKDIELVTDIFFKSVCLRICAIYELKESRDLNIDINFKKIWGLIFESISILPSDATISSIGSQGFLSIPLFKFNIDMEKFDFIRLHIWDDSLDDFINTKTCEDFSIHTHSFFAESWIICGKIINNRYNVNVVEDQTSHSLFTIGYNKSLNEVNQHTSNANNTNNFVNVNQISNENYSQGSHYIVKAGDYHKSISEKKNSPSATFFSFNGSKGLVEQSFVVGPSNVTISEINRKMHIDPIHLLNKINSKILSDGK